MSAQKLTPEQFQQVLVNAYEGQIKDTSLRLGQSFFNELYELYPELANEIRGNYKYDPFFNDKKLKDFFDYIKG